VGVNDPDQLARSSELQAGLRRKIGEMVSPMEYDPGSQFLAVRPQPEAPEHAPVTSEELSHISSSEWWMEHARYQPPAEPEDPQDFADLVK
jgi:hypothetical protein